MVDSAMWWIGAPVEESHDYIPFLCGNRDMCGPAEII